MPDRAMTWVEIVSLGNRCPVEDEHVVSGPRREAVAVAAPATPGADDNDVGLEDSSGAGFG